MIGRYLGIWVCGILCVVGSSPALARPTMRLSGEVGPEVDSNPARLTSSEGDAAPGQVAAPLLRLVGRAELLSQISQRHSLYGSYGGGGKLYLSEVGEPANELVQLGSLGWRVRLSPVTVEVWGRYYDAFLRRQVRCNTSESACPPPRDFRAGQFGLKFGLSNGRGSFASLGVSYHGFQFKPDDAFSFKGGRVGATFSHHFSRGRGLGRLDWALKAAYEVEVRRFGGATQHAIPCADLSSNRCGSIDGDTSRVDVLHQLHLEANYQGLAEASLWYDLSSNGSGSYGEGYMRHALGLRFTAPLFWSTFLSVTGVLQFSRFVDPLFARLATEGLADVDVENRSRLIVYLARDLGAMWSVGVRYSVYVNESGGASGGAVLPGFLRQTLFLGIRLDYDSSE